MLRMSDGGIPWHVLGVQRLHRLLYLFHLLLPWQTRYEARLHQIHNTEQSRVYIRTWPVEERCKMISHVI